MKRVARKREVIANANKRAVARMKVNRDKAKEKDIAAAWMILNKAGYSVKKRRNKA
jgi:hypothetical protein